MAIVQTQLDHVAFVLPDVEFTAEKLRTYGFPVGLVEVFEGEGTKEVYVGREFSSALLLMQPISPGSYEKALQKRGPSLHHLGLDVLNLEAFLLQALSAGWVLHPYSEKSKKAKKAWLFSPGFPSLLEVAEVKSFLATRPFVGGLKIKGESNQHKLIDVLNLRESIQLHSSNTQVLLVDQLFTIQDWLE